MKVQFLNSFDQAQSASPSEEAYNASQSVELNLRKVIRSLFYFDVDQIPNSRSQLLLTPLEIAELDEMLTKLYYHHAKRVLRHYNAYYPVLRYIRELRNKVRATGNKMSAPRRCRQSCPEYKSGSICVFCVEHFCQKQLQDQIVTSNKLKIPAIGYCGSYFDLAISIVNLVDGVSKSSHIHSFLMAILSFIKDITSMDYLDIAMKFLKPIKHIFQLAFNLMVDKSMEAWFNAMSLSGSEEKAMATVDFEDPTANAFFKGLHKMGISRNTIVKSDFVARLANFCGMIISLPFFAKYDIDLTCLGFSTAFERRRKKKYKYDHVVQLVDAILMEMKYFTEKIAIAVKAQDMGYILYDDDDRRDYDLLFDFMNYYYTKDELGSVDNAKFKQDGEEISVSLDWYWRKTDYLLEMNEKLSYATEDPLVKKDLKWQHGQIKRMNLASGDLLRVYAERRQPFALAIYAPPGSGKSAFGEISLGAMFRNAIIIGYLCETYNTMMKYTLNQRDKFMSGFRSSHLVTWLDDVDQFNPDITKMLEGGAITHSIEMINEVPLLTNQAGLGEKGKVPFKCPFVILTTNTPDAGISKVYQPGSGALRRFLFVNIVPKEEYQFPDNKKLKGAGDPKIDDLWDITIRRYVNVGRKYHMEWLSSVNLKTGEMVWKNGTHEPYVAHMKEWHRILYWLQKDMYETSNLAKACIEYSLNEPSCEVCGFAQRYCYCTATDTEEEDASATAKIGNLDMDDPLVQCFLRTYGMNGVMKMGLNELKYRSNTSKHYRTHVNKYCIAAGVAGVLAGIALLQKAVHAVCGFFKKSQVGMTFGYATRDVENPWSTEAVHVSDVRTTPVGVDIDNMRNILHRNVCFVRYRNYKGERISMCMLGIHGCIAVVPKHFFLEAFPWLIKPGNYNYDTGVTLYVTRGNVEKPYSLNRKIIVDNTCLIPGEGDFVFIDHPSLGPFKDIRSYFVNEKIEGMLDCLVTIRNDRGVLREENVNACTYSPNISYDLSENPDEGSFTICGYGGTYTSQMPFGVCGSPYFTQLPNKRIVILGIQVATGNTNGKSYCQQIFKSDIPECDLNSMPLKMDLQNYYSTDMDLTIKPDIHPKDPLLKYKETLEVVGSLEGSRAKLKSQVCPTLMAEDVMKWYGLKEPTHFSPKGTSSREAILKNYEYVTDNADIPPRLINKAADAMVEWYSRIIDENKLDFPSGPYSMDVGINGLDGVQYIDRLVGHTSAGFTHRGRKDKFFHDVIPDEYHQVKYDVDDKIKIEIDKLIACYERGEKSPIVADYCFKDEPLKLKKLMENDVRLFSCMPLSYNILFRMYFLPFVPLFTGRYRHLFGHAVGANPFKESEWRTLYEFLIKFGVTRIIAGDWKKFDKKMVAYLLNKAFGVLKRLAAKYGWSKYHLKIMQGLITDLIYCLVNCFNVLVMLCGTNPSGQPYTTIVNGIAGLLYLMVIFIVLAEENDVYDYDLSRWIEFVRSLVYGDDNIMGVSPKYPWYNHTNIARVAATFGLKYTMADKKSESVPYINIKKADFLKRKFLVRNDYVYAPLDQSSIIKSLHICTRSKNISFKQQCAEIIVSANMEWFQYGRKRFEHEHAFLNRMLDKYGLHAYVTINDGKLPDYNYYWDKFVNKKKATRKMEKEKIPQFEEGTPDPEFGEFILNETMSPEEEADQRFFDEIIWSICDIGEGMDEIENPELQWQFALDALLAMNLRFPDIELRARGRFENYYVIALLNHLSMRRVQMQQQANEDGRARATARVERLEPGDLDDLDILQQGYLYRARDHARLVKIDSYWAYRWSKAQNRFLHMIYILRDLGIHLEEKHVRMCLEADSICYTFITYFLTVIVLFIAFLWYWGLLMWAIKYNAATQLAVYMFHDLRRAPWQLKWIIYLLIALFM